MRVAYNNNRLIIKMIPNNGTCPLINANTLIGIEALSPKQILGECIDLATSLLKELVNHYLQNNNLNNPFGQKIDFSVLSNYILQPTRLQQILQQYVKGDDKSTKTLVKSWLFELKYMRNCWAHSEVIKLRLAIRSFDTLSLLYEALQGDTQTELFQKIEFYRKTLAVSQARTYVVS